MVALTLHLKGLDLSQAPVTLTGSCGHDPGIACRFVWDISHSGTAARLTAVYLAGPVNLVLRLAWLVFLALVARALVHRLINRVTIRAADAPLRSRCGRTPTRRTPAEAVAAQAAATWPPRPCWPGRKRPPTACPSRPPPRRRPCTRRHPNGATSGPTPSAPSSATPPRSRSSRSPSRSVSGDLGVNLAPVLASAGVVGIAVGFGAQNLVRDFLAGIFMLLEDQYGVGDVINIGDATGTVEAVSLRTTRLRDVNGVVWHLRNGALEKVGNESQGWARAVVDIPIPPELEIGDTRTLMEHAAGQHVEGAALAQAHAGKARGLGGPGHLGVADRDAGGGQDAAAAAVGSGP